MRSFNAIAGRTHHAGRLDQLQRQPGPGQGQRGKWIRHGKGKPPGIPASEGGAGSLGGCLIVARV